MLLRFLTSAGSAAVLAAVSWNVIDLALLLAVFLWVPLLLNSIHLQQSMKVNQLLTAWWYPFSLAGGLAVILPEGIYAGTAAAVWFCFTLLVAVSGVIRQLQYGMFHRTETVIHMGMAYLMVGGGWLFLSSAGFAAAVPYSDIIVRLTAVHFHYAAFLLPVVFGLTSRYITSRNPLGRWWKTAAVLLSTGPILVAIGINQGPPLEFFLVCVYAIGLILFISWWTKQALIKNLLPTPARIMVLGAASILLVTTSFAVIYSFGLFQGAMIVQIPWMVQWHGAINAIGFSGLAVAVVLVLNTPPPSVSFPYSRLKSDGFTGKTPIESGRWQLDETRKPALVARWHDYKREGFEPKHVSASIRHFYADPLAYSMTATITWARWLRPFQPFIHSVTRWMGQLNVPGDGRVTMTGNLLPIYEKQDGRPLPSVWLRKREDTGEPVFTAVYSYHKRNGITFMNIALPFSGGLMTGVLRPDHDEQDGLVLTSHQFAGDEGIYLTIGGTTFRTPLAETFHIRTAQGGSLQACHRMSVFGLPFLSLKYDLKQRQNSHNSFCDSSFSE